MAQNMGSRDFHHPFSPYPIQTDFMNAVYDCIQGGQVGIFESPTGTGKSLSLICGAMTWLRDHQQDGLDGGSTAGEEPDWVLEHAKKSRQDTLLRARRDLENRLTRVREKERHQKQRYENGEPIRKRLKSNHEPAVTDEEEFLLDYESEESTSKPKPSGPEGLSAVNMELMIKLGMASKPAEEEEEEEEELEQSAKVFYCSRTHSQLAQFANELRRVKMPPSIPLEADPERFDTPEAPAQEVKHVSLGSRKNLCINPQVSRLGSQTAINERCIELQQGKAADKKICEFLPTQENEPLVHQFRDHTLARIRDIEDLGSLGKRLGICPYYASRATTKSSEIVTLPYPLMLQKSAREALGLSLKDQIVVIDEAHNLLDAISSVYSAVISLSQLKRARQQVGTYLQKFRNKLKSKNRVYVTQIVRVIDSLAAYLETKQSKSKETDGIASLVDLMAGKGVDQVNLYKLSHYLQESKLARKVDGYVTHIQESKQAQQQDRTSPVLMQVQSFFQALTYPAAEGRFFHAKTDDGDICLKYLLLDPMHHFKEIVDEARAVIMAGGTMSPMEDYTRYLLPYLPPERIRTLSCGHIVPDSHLCAWPISTGPTGAALDFTFEKRQQPATVVELGRCVLALSACIPDGLAVFFPSYAYLAHCASAWQQPPTGTGARGNGGASLWAQLTARKPVFREAQGGSADAVLAAYTAAIHGGGRRGALLLAVVGGRLSEGINFADRLGRGVAIVGLPFPNARGAEWRARLEYVERQQGGGAPGGGGAAAAREFYENACMRAVNQSVGRVIRHQEDYATIALLDRRYQTPRIRAKLPGWIQSAVAKNVGERGFEEVTKSMNAFFAGKAT